MAAPYCGSYNQIYDAAAVVKATYEIQKLDDRAGDCGANADCFVWEVVVQNITEVKKCTLKVRLPVSRM